MAFKFDFDLDDLDIGEGSRMDTHGTEENQSAPTCGADTLSSKRCNQTEEIPLKDLLSSLPEKISYSPLSIPSLGHPATTGQQTRIITLARRDLFDARFHLMSEDSQHDRPNSAISADEEGLKTATENPLQFLDTPSDLVPGVYEGGFKTWECSLDLAGYLDSEPPLEIGEKNTNVLEIGCGTAVPSLYIIHRLFSQDIKPTMPTTNIDLQDYNRSVIELITVPNIILAWYLSPASAAYLSSRDKDSESDDEDAPGDPDPSIASELTLTPTLKSAFLDSLKVYNIHLRFFCGSWETFSAIPRLRIENQVRYDLVLSSETIYRTDSLTSLLQLLIDVCSSGRSVAAHRTICLIAAKLIYFGVGGGVDDFVRGVEQKGGTVHTAWENRIGVGRRIMKLDWAAQV